MAIPTELRLRRFITLLGGWLLMLPSLAAPPLKLHVPSPDWRDQVIYFVMTDRFDDGEPANNDQGAGEFDPRSNAHYNGGDFAGLQRRIDYIRGLGATALWITPPVANQWWDAGARYSGYHGYWAENFMQVDKHLGTLDDYRALSHALHRQGLYLVQDIVLNHTGNFFGYSSDWSAGNPARGYRPNTGARPVAAPTQPPFDLNDPRDPAQRAAGIYHWTPDVRDFKQPQQVLNWQMAGLDDLNTEHPRVRRALRQSYGHWIREVGVDAFRVDTAFYVPPGLFADFLRSTDPQAPGMARVARATGRRGFYTVGEGFGIDAPFEAREARRIERYVRGPGGAPLMTGMLNFPLYGSLGDALARGAPAAVLGHRITQMMRVHRAPHLMATFVDNHDVDRFLAGGSEAGLRQALLAIMTLPGVPVLYYGTEQGFTAQRGAMFAAGHGSGGRDRFDTTHPLYQTIARLTTLRRTHPLFSRGVPTVLQASATGPGVLAWRMQHGGDAALVVLNTADTPVLMHRLPTGAPAGIHLTGLLALDGEPTPLRTGADGRVTAVLPPRSAQVWRLPVVGRQTAAAALSTGKASALSVASVQVIEQGNRLQARGRAPAGAELQLLIDGDLARATPVRADALGRWQAEVDIGHLGDPSGGSRPPHQLLAWSPAQQRASAAWPLTVQRSWTLLADVADPALDDHGPDGRYVYPTDASWGDRHQMDLRRARVWRSGSALRIELTMAQVTQLWSPQNGFDHVAFTLHFSQRGRPDGIAELPLLNARLPGGGVWQHRLRAHGWSNAWFSAEGASAHVEGTPLTPGAMIEVDRARQRVRFTLPAGALGKGAELAGLQLHISTWDYDGGYRALAAQPGGHTLGGGAPDAPKLMDQLLLTLP
jgi:glycosidase